MRRTDFIYISIIVVLFIILFLQKECNSKRVSQLELQSQLQNDTAKIFRDKYGRANAEVVTIISDYKSLKQSNLNTIDSITKLLVKAVNKRTVNATVVTQVVSIDTMFKTDTVIYANEDSCSPTYVLNDTAYGSEDSSITRIIDISASKDSFDVSVKEFETLVFKTEWSKWKPFKKQSCISTYQNSNPDIIITGMRTFTVKCDCSKNFILGSGLGFIGGFAVGFGGGYLYRSLK